jgi:hypothetical protein
MRSSREAGGKSGLQSAIGWPTGWPTVPASQSVSQCAGQAPLPALVQLRVRRNQRTRGPGPQPQLLPNSRRALQAGAHSLEQDEAQLAVLHLLVDSHGVAELINRHVLQASRGGEGRGGGQGSSN